MLKMASTLILLLAAAAALSAQTPTATPTSSPTPAAAPATQLVVPHTSLKVGQMAPDFTLPSTIAGPDGRSVRYKLSDFRTKKNVVLAFYVLAFTGG